MTRGLQIGILSVVPSPYQRDLFSALAKRPEVDLSVFYQSVERIDNPWPESVLQPYESALPGRRFSYGAKHLFLNWDLPDLRSFDAVILNTSHASPTAQWLMRTQLHEVPWIFWGERLRQQLNPFRRLAHAVLTNPLSEASAIACIGSIAVEAYRERFPDQRLANIPYHCDLGPFLSTSSKSESSEVVFLFCGQMIRRKGIDLLLDAFDRLVHDNAPVRLRLVGTEADLSRHMSEMSESGRRRVEVLGFQAPEDLPELFQQADVFVLPSRHDGWGVVVNEALGSGLPIICSDAVGAAHDLVVPGENGVRIPAGEVEPLREAMARMVDRPDLRTQWGQNSRATAADWSPEAGAERWINLLGKVLAPSAAPSAVNSPGNET
ncbi:glycosyltransferase family 4 protein [Salinibacter ruber]|uniref:glycosyltransferase family 4 protein n=1 Tax=Salinibacter ruber TaxID=146919 RepID=UPI0021697179|nr:glycosyltransferase family 4 protein [Salinibacter ruber]MCS4054638.1 glycosyltransferase involved in cell wall biosynthesis [Salinibacter ruber]